MLDTGVLLVRVLLRILIGRIRGNLVRDLGCDQLPDAVAILPGDVPEQIVEASDDIGEPVEFRVGLVPAAVGGNGVDLGILIRQLNALRGLLLDPVAIHVDRFENALREVLLAWRRQLRDQEVEEDRELLPIRIREGQDGRDEGVGPGECLRLALEINLPVLVEVRIVDGDARIQDGVQLIPVGAAQIELDKLIDLAGLVDLDSRRGPP